MIERTRLAARGAALPGVLAVMAAMLVASAGGFEASLSDARAVGAFASRSIAFHAAQAALDACERDLVERVALIEPPLRAASSTVGDEPEAWRQAGALDGPDAVRPFARWPGSAASPVCLVERWSLALPSGRRAYLLTARGTGSSREVRVWLQLQIAFEGAQVVARGWRSVVAAPSPESRQ